MKITFTEQAAEQLAELAEYLELEWSLKVRDNFLLKVEQTENRFFNLAHGTATRLDEAARLIQNAAMPKTLQISFGNGSDAFRAPFCVNTTRLQKLGWKPQGSLEAEARDTIRFFT